MTYAHGAWEFKSAEDVHLGDAAVDGSAWYNSSFLPAIAAIQTEAAKQPPALQQAMSVLIADAYGMAGPVATGKTDGAGDLIRMLRQMQTAIQTWDNAEPTLFDTIEQVIRNIPANLAKAADLVETGLTRAVDLLTNPLAKGAGNVASGIWPLVGLGVAGLGAFYLFPVVGRLFKSKPAMRKNRRR